MRRYDGAWSALQPPRLVCPAHNFPSEVAEMALAHAVGSKVEAAYRRGDLYGKRQQLMDHWATFCTPPAAVATTRVSEIREAVS